MAIAGGRGVQLQALPTDLPGHTFLFGEDQSRYLLETPDPDAVLEAAREMGIPARVIGVVDGVSLTLPGAGAISVDTLKAMNEAWLPSYMAQV
jgi:phosphoribosylformylglycinamidine synthase subunit PurL